MPSTPPKRELGNTSRKFTVISGCVDCRIYSAGNVKIVPATITPEQAPIDWMITFRPKGFFFLSLADRPTAIIAIGIAASKPDRL